MALWHDYFRLKITIEHQDTYQINTKNDEHKDTILQVTSKNNGWNYIPQGRKY